jgi:hypothetical protein
MTAESLQEMYSDYGDWVVENGRFSAHYPWHTMAVELGKLTKRESRWTYPPRRKRAKKMSYWIPAQRQATSPPSAPV